MSNLQSLYHSYCLTHSDINYHLPKLKEIGEKVNHITEFGVRTGVSSVALLSSKPHTLISYDINPFNQSQLLDSLKGDTNYQFIQKSVLEIEIEETDFLFIDTLHTYDQLKQELELHSSKVRKFIAFHDTHLFGTNGELPNTQGLNLAIIEFLNNNTQWSIIYNTSENNGLLVLEKN